MTMNDYVKYDGLALAELVRGGEVSPIELLDASIERIERHNSTLNAVVQTQYECAKAVVAKPESIPDGPFKGVPFLVKALFHADGGVPMTNASRYFEHFVPEEDCELVARYKQAGLVICGRTNTPENGINAVTESALYGPSRNPWSPKHTPGGSSCGAAAAVASGMVPIANGSDGGGSIRIPASCCGLFGLKPSRMPHAGRSTIGRSMERSCLPACAKPQRARQCGDVRRDGRCASWGPVCRPPP